MKISFLILSFLIFGSNVLIAQTDSTEIKLKQYKEWYDQGIVTEKEYQELKNKVLNPLKVENDTKQDSLKKRTVWRMKNGHHFGIRGGVTIAFAKNNNVYLAGDFKPLTGANGAVFYQYYRNHLVLITELAYTQKGFSQNVQFTDALGNNLKIMTQKTSYGFIELPILAGVRLKSVNIFGGVSNGINIFGKTTFPSITIGGTSVSSYKIELEKKYEASFIVGLSNDFVIARRYAIPLEIRYGVGLNTPATVRLQYIAISTGFKF
jgi:hypothetical protein